MYHYELQEVLRELVCGIQHEGTQKRHLAEADFTLKQALEIAQGIEAADKCAQSLKNKDILQCSHSHSQSCQDTPYCCGKSNHDPQQCRFREAECHHCSWKGHIAKVCKARRGAGKTRRAQR